MSQTVNAQEYDETLCNDFLDEATDLLSSTENDFIQLEKDPENSLIVDKLFRIVHTIKGSAAIAGFKSMNGFAHIFETLLSKIKAKEVAVTPAVIDIMLASTDILSKFTVALRTDREAAVDTRLAVTRIYQNLEPTPPARAPEAIARGDLNSPSTPKVEARDSGYQDIFNEGRTRPKFLIIDDAVEIIDVIVEMLAVFNAEITTAQSGTEAIMKYDTVKNFDVIFTDQKMPDLDGTEIVKYIRSRDKNIPIIVITGATNREDAIKFIQAGVFDLLQKPIIQEDLIASVHKAIDLYRYHRTLVELSKHIFRSYISFRKISEIIERTGSPSDQDLVKSFSGALQNISVLTNRLLITKDEA